MLYYIIRHLTVSIHIHTRGVLVRRKESRQRPSKAVKQLMLNIAFAACFFGNVLCTGAIAVSNKSILVDGFHVVHLLTLHYVSGYLLTLRCVDARQRRTSDEIRKRTVALCSFFPQSCHRVQPVPIAIKPEDQLTLRFSDR